MSGLVVGSRELPYTPELRGKGVHVRALTAAELRRVARVALVRPLVLYVSVGVSAGLERFSTMAVTPLTFGLRIGAHTPSPRSGEDVDRRYRVLAEEGGALLMPLPGSTGDRLAAGR